MTELGIRIRKNIARIAEYNIFGYQIQDHIEEMGQINTHDVVKKCKVEYIREKSVATYLIFTFRIFRKGLLNDF